jgi:hypothetical protein
MNIEKEISALIRKVRVDPGNKGLVKYLVHLFERAGLPLTKGSL